MERRETSRAVRAHRSADGAPWISFPGTTSASSDRAQVGRVFALPDDRRYVAPNRVVVLSDRYWRPADFRQKGRVLCWGHTLTVGSVTLTIVGSCAGRVAGDVTSGRSIDAMDSASQSYLRETAGVYRPFERCASGNGPPSAGIDRSAECAGGSSNIVSPRWRARTLASMRQSACGGFCNGPVALRVVWVPATNRLTHFTCRLLRRP